MSEPLEATQQFLNNCAWFNDGKGLQVSPTLAAKLKTSGIDGPFFVTKPLPTTNGAPDREPQDA